MDNLVRSIIAPRNPSNPDPYSLFNEHCEQVLDTHLKPVHYTSLREHLNNNTHHVELLTQHQKSTPHIRGISNSNQHQHMYAVEVALLNTKTPRSRDNVHKMQNSLGLGEDEVEALKGLPPYMAEKIVQERRKAVDEFHRQQIHLQNQQKNADNYSTTNQLNMQNVRQLKDTKNHSITSYTLSPHTIAPASPFTTTRLYRHPNAMIFQAGYEPGTLGTAELNAQVRLSDKITASAYVITDMAAKSSNTRDKSHSIIKQNERKKQKRKNSTANRKQSSNQTPIEMLQTSIDNISSKVTNFYLDTNDVVNRAVEGDKIYSLALSTEGDLWNASVKYSSDESVAGISGVYRIPLTSKPPNAADFTLNSRLFPYSAANTADEGAGSDSKSGLNSSLSLLPGYDATSSYLSDSVSKIKTISKNFLQSTNITSGIPTTDSGLQYDSQAKYIRPSVDYLVEQHRLPYTEGLDVGGEILYSLESGGDQFSLGGRLVISPERVRIHTKRTLDRILSYTAPLTLRTYETLYEIGLGSYIDPDLADPDSFQSKSMNINQRPSSSISSSDLIRETAHELARETDAEELRLAKNASRLSSLVGHDRKDRDFSVILRKFYEKATSSNATPSHSYSASCTCLHCIKDDILTYRRTPITISTTVNGIGTASVAATIPVSKHLTVSSRLRHNLASRESQLEVGTSFLFTNADITKLLRRGVTSFEDGRDAATVYDTLNMATEIRDELDREYEKHVNLLTEEEVAKGINDTTRTILGKGTIGHTASMITTEFAPTVTKSKGWTAALKSYFGRFTNLGHALWTPRNPIEQVCMIEKPDCSWHQIRTSYNASRGYNIEWNYVSSWFTIGVDLGSTIFPNSRLNHVFPPVQNGVYGLNGFAVGKEKATPSYQTQNHRYNAVPNDTPIWNTKPFDKIGFTCSFEL